MTSKDAGMHSLSGYKSFSKAVSFVSILAGCLVLWGWAFDVASLKSVFPGLATMKANTAAGFILAGASLRMLQGGEVKPPMRQPARMCAGIVALLGFLTLGEYLFERDFGIDRLLFPQGVGAEQTPHPGRMSPAAALNFLLLGLALLVPDSRRGEFPALIALLVSALALVGYAYGVSSLYGIGPYSSMAVHTAILFMALSLGVLFARPRRGLMAILASDALGGFMARRLLPAAVGIPFALGGLRLMGQYAGWYDTEFGLALFALSNTAILSAAILWSAERLNGVDRGRTQAQESLRHVLRARTVMAECNRALVRAGDETELLRGMCQTVAAAGGYPAAWIGMACDDADKTVTPVAWARHEEGYFKDFHFTWAESEPGDTPTGIAIRSGQTFVANDLETAAVFPPWREQALRRGYRSAVSLPLKNGGRPWGALTILAAEPACFSADEVVLFEELADDIAYGVRSLRAHAAKEGAEAGLRIAEARFSGILDIAHDAIVSIDPTQRIVLFNKGAERIFGYAEAEVVGKPLDLLLPNDHVRERHRRHVMEFARSGLVSGSMETGHREIWGLRKDGQVFPAEATISKLEIDGKKILTAILRDITERKRYEAHIEHLANYDALTGLRNRNLLNDRFGQCLAHIRRSGGLMALLFLDLDRFKDINDSYGHALGDALLKEVAKRLQEAVREGDTVARQGGDEFIILLFDIGCLEDLEGIAAKLLEVLSQPLVMQGHELYLVGSIGASLCPNDGEDLATLLKNADTAMYRAKDEGGNVFRVYTQEMGEHAVERVEMENALRHGLERGEFELFYQPKVELQGGGIVGAEALIRWHHPEQGMVSPGRFIPVAEASGLIVPLGLWVLQTACAQNKAWQDAGLPPMTVAVNVSAGQMLKEDLLAVVEQALLASGLESRYLELEVTESMVMENPERMIPILGALKARGVRLSLDDFGTGYSSLSYLKRFPFDLLKIDQSFVRDIPADPDDAAIALTVISLGHSLGLKVIAEGVETGEQLDFLHRHGCDEIQGYYFSKPVPADEFARLLREGKRLGVAM